MSYVSSKAVREVLSNGGGRVGAVLLASILLISLFVVLTFPLDFGTKQWSNPAAWADNPKSAPPVWTSFMSDDPTAEHIILKTTRIASERKEGNLIVRSYALDLEYTSLKSPGFVALSMSNFTYYGKAPYVSLFVHRPDGTVLEPYHLFISGPAPGETSPISRFEETPFRVNLGGEREVISVLSDLYRESYGQTLTRTDIFNLGAEKLLFGVIEDSGSKRPSILPGSYRFRVDFASEDPRDSLHLVKLVVGGSVFGAMGTDALGRDLAIGLLFGFPVALVIGLTTAVAVTAIGALLGITSGYVGGRVDTIIQRTSDVLANMPLLPLLIFFAFVLGQKLIIVILILIAFSWPGLTIVIRSMVLQVKAAAFVEAARAMGASRKRIMLRHIFPQVAPFVFSQLVFLVPGAILAEAALSFLGLGDPSIPTWGQILEYGFRSGAIYVGFWWWILPPGLLIVITATSFVLLALSLEPLVNPRLRGVER